MKKKSSFPLLFGLSEVVLFAVATVLIFVNIVLSVICYILTFVSIVSVISCYNTIVRRKNKIEESFALIDVHLKLRFDLIPNLVNVVKKYAEHEKGTLVEITKLRRLAQETADAKEKVDYANKVLPHVKSLIAVAESSPELKANSVYKSLIEQLVDVEDRLVASRRIYDSNVAMYNTTIEVFPTNFVARRFGFEKAELFRIDAGEKLLPHIDMRNL